MFYIANPDGTVQYPPKDGTVQKFNGTDFIFDDYHGKWFPYLGAGQYGTGAPQPLEVLEVNREEVDLFYGGPCDCGGQFTSFPAQDHYHWCRSLGKINGTT